MGPPDKWPIADTFWVVATNAPRHFREDWPSEMWENNLPSDYISYPRKTEPIEIPNGMTAIGLQYYNTT